MRKVKKWAALGLACAMTLSMAACGGGDDGKTDSGSTTGGNADSGTSGADSGASSASGTETPAADNGASGDKTKISMAVWNGSWGEDLQKIQEDFNSKNPDIDLDIQMQTGDYSDFLGAKVAADDLPDIYLLTPYKQVQAFAEAGRLTDLSGESFVDKVYPEALEAGKGADGTVYAYPSVYEYLGVFYNKELFKTAGIETLPTTRDEFADACAKLEAAGIQPIAPTYKES